MSKIFTTVVLLFIASLSLLVLSVRNYTFAQNIKTWTVCQTPATGCDFSASAGIQQAIDTAQINDNIHIREGTYVLDSHISIIWKRLRIEGDGFQKTIISGENLPEGRNTALEIQGSEISLGKMQIKGGNKNSDGGISIYSTGLREHYSIVNIYGVEIKDHDYNGIVLSGASTTPNTVRVKNSLIHHNGVGIQIVYNAQVEITNNVISYNTDNIYTHHGTGIWVNENLIESSNISLRNNIFAGNKWTGGILVVNNLNRTTQNYNLFWDNTQNYINVPQGQGEITGDPKFANMTDFKIAPDSPAINAGDPSIQNPDGSRSSMGAYGGPGACDLTEDLPGCQNSPTTTITPLPTNPNCPLKSKGDVNCDGKTDESDFIIWKCEFRGNGTCNNPPSQKSADFNTDELINLVDFEIFRRNFI